MKPNILFIVIDSLHPAKFYGDEKTSITPNIDSLIKQGTYFSQTISSAPSTLPALCSVFTSLYPFESVIRDKKNFVLNPRIPNYGSLFRKSGYTTYAMVPEIITYYGFVDGFNKISTYPKNSTIHDDVGFEIIKQLESKVMTEPWLYYIHLLDVSSFKKFDENKKLKKFHDTKFGMNKYEQMVSAMDIGIGNIIQKINLNNTIVILTADHSSDDANYTKKLEEYKINTRRYTPGLIINSSTKIGKKTPNFLLALKSKLRKTYVDRRKKILLQRSEKEFSNIQNLDLSPYEKRVMENAVKTNYHVFDDRLKVPFLIVGNKIPRGKIIKSQVRSIDIFPTITEIAGISHEHDIRGRSLIPMIEGKKVDELTAFVESATNHTDSLNDNVIGIRTSKFKYFRDRMNPKNNVNLFNLEEDPHEENNIVNEQHEVAQKMENLLLEIKSNGNFNNQVEEDILNDEDISRVNEELKKLGYI